MWSRSRLGRSTRRFRGSVVVYVAFFLGVLLAASTLAIDIGRLYNAQRDLQRAANLAALDAAAVSGGCYGNFGGDLQDDPLGLAQTEAADSLARNNLPSGYLTGSSPVQIGKLTSQGGKRVFTPLSPGEDVNARTAVQVTLQRPTPNRLLPLTSSGTMIARAAADSRPRVTVGVASSTADVTLLRGLFGNMGGAPVGLTVAGYQGLLNTYVRLGDLATNLGVGSVDDLLTASTPLPLDDVLNALGQGQTGGVASLLHALAANVNGPNVVLGDVIAAPLGLGESGADAVLNVGQMVNALAQAANGDNLINLPINLNLAGVTTTAQLRVIEPEQVAIIRAGVTPLAGNFTSYGEDSYAHTAQAALQLHVKANLGIPILASIAVDVPLYLQIAKATATLDEVRCVHRGQPQHEVDLAVKASIAELGLGVFDDINAPNPQPTSSKITIASIDVLGILLKPLLGGKLLTLQSSPIQVPVSTQSETLTFEGPFASDFQGISTPVAGSLASGLTGLTGASLQACLGACGSAINVGLNALIASAKTLVGTLLTSILGALDATLAPLLDALGIDAGNAQFQIVSLDPVNSTEINPTADQQLSLQAFLFNH